MLSHDPKARGLQAVPEFGTQTVAVLLAELGAVTRFQRLDQVVAYVGMDIERTAEWQMARPGETFQTRERAGPAYALHGRHTLHLAAWFGLWGLRVTRLLARGLGKKTALMAVMRKMVVIAAYLLRTEEDYDPIKVAGGTVA